MKIDFLIAVVQGFAATLVESMIQDYSYDTNMILLSDIILYQDTMFLIK